MHLPSGPVTQSESDSVLSSKWRSKERTTFHLPGQPHGSIPGVNQGKEDVMGIKDRNGQSFCLFVINDSV